MGDSRLARDISSNLTSRGGRSFDVRAGDGFGTCGGTRCAFENVDFARANELEIW